MGQKWVQKWVRNQKVVKNVSGGITQYHGKNRFQEITAFSKTVQTRQKTVKNHEKSLKITKNPVFWRVYEMLHCILA